MEANEILEEIGLTDAELRDYLVKLSAFYDSLNPSQQKVFRAGMSSLESALKSFQRTMTADQLQKFIKEREPKGAKVVFILEGVDGDDDSHKKK